MVVCSGGQTLDNLNFSGNFNKFQRFWTPNDTEYHIPLLLWAICFTFLLIQSDCMVDSCEDEKMSLFPVSLTGASTTVNSFFFMLTAFPT